jgi:hypothetical protein
MQPAEPSMRLVTFERLVTLTIGFAARSKETTEYKRPHNFNREITKGLLVFNAFAWIFYSC